MSRDAWNRYSERGSWFYQVQLPGFKYNMSDVQASIGLHQLRKLDRFTALRTTYAHQYNEYFADLAECEIPPDREDCKHAWHIYSLRLNLEKLRIDRDEFITQLRNAGIGSSVHFIPVPLHPYFSKYTGQSQDVCPKAVDLYHRIISLPIYPDMTEEQVDFVAQTTKRIAISSRKKAVFAAVSPA
jgi:dTDP-4-amino-4,6-dideoxygalactose transaminase